MSRSQNQIRAASFPASPGESESETPAGHDTQAPTTEQSHALASAEDAAPGTSEELPAVQGVHTPPQH